MLFLFIVLNAIAANEQLIFTITLTTPLKDNYIKTKISDQNQEQQIYYTTTLDQYPQSAQTFDFFQFKSEDEYEVYLNDYYRTKRSLTCIESDNIGKIDIGISEIQLFGDNQIYVIDNTELPCNGSNTNIITPWISVVIQFDLTRTYYYLKNLLIFLIVIVSIVEIIAIIVVNVKLHKLQKKNQRRKLNYMINRLTVK